MDSSGSITPLLRSTCSLNKPLNGLARIISTVLKKYISNSSSVITVNGNNSQYNQLSQPGSHSTSAPICSCRVLIPHQLASDIISTSSNSGNATSRRKPGSPRRLSPCQKNIMPAQGFPRITVSVHSKSEFYTMPARCRPDRFYPARRTVPVTPQRLERIEHTLSLRQPDLTVLTDEVHKDRNLSAIVRSCDAFAVPVAHCVWLGEQYRVRRNHSAGSGNWVDIHTHPDIGTAIQTLQQQGFRVCAAHFSERARDYRDYDFTQPTALLLGSEKTGVSAQAAALADEHLVIPMHGMVQSFNVSVAAALLLSEAQRQRQQAGMFNQ